MKTIIKIYCSLFLYLFFAAAVPAQSNTVGLILNDSLSSFNGYTLFSPLTSTKTYLIDNDGNLIHSWNSDYRPGQAVMLLADGSLLRSAVVETGNPFTAGGSGGRVEKYDWDGNLVWYFNCYSQEFSSHHDIEILPDGNILLIVWEKKSSGEVSENGRIQAGEIWSEKIIEIKPDGNSGGEIVWEWHAWEHLIQDYDRSKKNFGDVQAHPELIDVNFGLPGEDWLHINSVRYNPGRDEILLSVHNFSEIWVIDHSTNTEEAAGHTGGKKGKGGDLLFRWGNPQAYRSGSASDQKLFAQHDARWIEDDLPGAGDIMIFNNGQGRPDGSFSSVDEITPLFDAFGNYLSDSSGRYSPDGFSWSFTGKPGSTFFAQNISGAERLPNGNTLICNGPSGLFFEIDSQANTVWKYINPVTRNGVLTQGDSPAMNAVFKIYRYPRAYGAFDGKDLSPVGKIENTTTDAKNGNAVPYGFRLEQNYPNPFNPSTTIKYSIPNVTTQNILPGRQAGTFLKTTLKIYDLLGNEVATLVNEYKPAGEYAVNFNSEKYSSGVYIYKLYAGNFSKAMKMICLK